MRYIFFSFLLSFCLASVSKSVFAFEYSPPSSLTQNIQSEPLGKDFEATASRLVQNQINLIARIERALSEPDSNRVRSVRGQLTVYTKAAEAFLKSHYNSPNTLCTARADSLLKLSSFSERLTDSQAQIYCSLYASSQELLKLTPVLDRLLSRRGELALVRSLGLVSGERQSDPVLSIAPVQRPNLGKPATPLSTQEPNVPLTPPQIIGRTAKTAIADYIPPMQPAIAPIPEAVTTLASAKKFLTAAQALFPPETKFQDPVETATILDRFAYDIDPQEPQTYAKFLDLPNTGIFRVLPYSAYQRQLNTLQNRLQPSVRERYPFPSLGEAKGGLTPSLALHMVGERFNLAHLGVDYGFMVNVGDIPLEKLDGNLKAVAPQTREFFLNYQPPKKLEALQVERRRFLTGKNQNWNQSQVILAGAKAELNQTYLVRSLQFQIPEIILSGKPISRQDRIHFDQLLKMQGSDIILAFRPVRRRADGSYTVLWRVLNQLPEPKIEDLEEYVTLKRD
ncbi:MAG: hypothetical protein ACHBN1_10530 [Heteroscytonema crispum UTEX LB 1556]